MREAGYVFVYLSYENESNNWVYFDDFKVTHTKSRVVQYNEYYPFGLQTANSWTRENVTANKFLANGGTELNTTTSLYDLDFRNYDPVLGRMHQIDPMAAKYASLTPYNYSFNNPVRFNDPFGDDPNRPGDWDYTGSYLEAYSKGWNAGTAPIAVMDPGGGGAYTIWDPATAGGYGVAGYMGPLAPIISSYNPNYMGPVRYVDGNGQERNAFPTVLSWAARIVYGVDVSPVVTELWNPWIGEQDEDGNYQGGWSYFNFAVLKAIIREGYEVKTRMVPQRRTDLYQLEKR